ncbi:dihydropteroate synthase [Loktanella ponticola]|uniref:Dihydropteroate synthase n=2 Tax=Yoonia ponticola TaxID=1524255 RepID=A0A7W9BMY1_9RHOB|nr:dihydropteroate synthase [Yoonia ponticola]MBB5723316.1 dihydropteroate synthase [Yoonia ponticola]
MYIQPIPQTTAYEDALRLGGSSWLFAETALVRDRGESGEEVLVEDLTADQQTRISRQRATICGLTLDVPRIMGILNVTPDSFSDGGTIASVAEAVDRAKIMAQDADIIDIGGESTRPGATEVSIKDEINRTAPVIRAIRDAGITTPISIDTRKALVARAALEAGANMVNDVSAMRFDPEIAGVAADADCPICLMHSQGLPDTMQDNPDYADVVFDVFDHLAAQIAVAEAAGIRRENLITDPGIGFGKTLQHNLSLVRDLAIYHDLGLPILLGASRKRFIGTISGEDDAAQRLGGSIAVALHGAAQGAQILRVHDVKQTKQALSLQLALNGAVHYG